MPLYTRSILPWLLALTIGLAPAVMLAQPRPQPAPEKVRLQLKWFNQFQFAGYYAAIEQGYYAAEGLDVEIVERDLDKSVIRQVATGEADYGIGDAGLLSAYARGEPVVLLAAIFQHNPLVFMTKQDSGIDSPYEMKGKRIMSDVLSADEASLSAVLAGANITAKDYTLLRQTNDYEGLLRGQVDVISGYLSDQPFYYQQQGAKINIINLRNYGIDFYGDMLFTSKAELHDHPGRADRFLRASLRGWQYALEHREQLIGIIAHRYHCRLPLEHLRFEAEAIHKLILPESIPLGHVDIRRLRMMADNYANAGFNKKLSDIELAAFVHNETIGGLHLNDQEKNWLANHPVIRVGIDSNFAPYEWLDENDNYVGMAADYMRLLERELGVKFEIVGHHGWDEILALAKRGELDMLAAAVDTPERSEYLTFTKPYKSSPAVIVDNGQDEFIGSLDNLAGKRIAVEKGYFMQELLQRYYPKIRLILAADINEALNFVVDGKADAYVGDAASANYAIKKHGLLGLRFSGQTEYFSRHSVAVGKRNPELASIINKAMASIPSAESDEIFSRWLGLRVEQGIKPETAVKYALAVLAFFLLFSYWLVRLRLEIRIRRQAEKREQHRNRVLQQLIEKSPIQLVLESLARNVESINPGMLCSIALLDEDGKHLRHVAAPSLPAFYTEAVNEIPIGNGVCSCGAAAYSGNRVIVEDIEAHPGWLPYLGFARQAGLAACCSQPILSARGKVLGTFSIYHRHTYRPSKNDLQLIEYEARLAALCIEKSAAESQLQLAANVFKFAREGILITDIDGNILEVNDTFSLISGYSREEVLGKNPRLLQSGRHDRGFFATLWLALIEDGFWNGEIWNRRKNGEIFVEMLTISAVRDGNGITQSYVGLFIDITLMKEYQQQLEHIAHFDDLTGLPNRVLLADRLRQAVIHNQRHSYTLAVAYLDLDGFKWVNDNHGHDMGDKLLVTIAQRMKTALREGDTLARIGGDEFVAILVELETPETCIQVLERLIKAAAEPAIIDAVTLQVSASIGVTLYPQDNADSDQLLRHADQAMYLAKQSGKNRYHLFDVAHDTAITNRQKGLEHIRGALRRQEFVLFYQPKVNMRTGVVIGAEALIRWRHPERGLLPPAEFLPLIEEDLLGVKLGEWVIDSALSQMEVWNAAGLDIPVSVNISPRHLQQENFVDRLKSLIAAHPNIKPCSLELEVLETSALRDVSRVTQFMHACKEMGVRFALDDFGTGYSSLTYLRRLPADLLKIDQSFVRDMLDDHEDLAIVNGVISLAAAFNREVIAEGVETAVHAERLLALDCELGQGYGFARPMPAEDLPDWIANWRGPG